jgi:hypothetical protein
MLNVIFIKKKEKKNYIIINVILSIEEGNNQTSTIKDSNFLLDLNLIPRELFLSEIKEFYPAIHIK